ncbi:hypothetical protein [Rhizobium ruizarguesonis]|uniref:hypothetical protein n=1 Tax=Rhizobium ruizarguesonis TaxID=2081791 RepID=UPI00102F5CE4|nr:hypothetical protein [Rhizobium ruizarguesonis]TBE87768.1 hypothetical protein ELG99_13435 [Rhizobium ruizarguesonis]
MNGLAITNLLLAVIAGVLLFGKDALLGGVQTLALVLVAIVALYFVFWLAITVLIAVATFLFSTPEMASAGRQKFKEIDLKKTIWDAAKGLSTLYTAPIGYPIKEFRFRRAEGAGIVVTTLSCTFAVVIGLVITGLFGFGLPAMLCDLATNPHF